MLILANLIYFIGLAFYSVVFYVSTEEELEGSFVEALDHRDILERAIVCVYFSFTSLSTVGLGDYYPGTNLERVVFCFVLVFGVAIFSYVLGVFTGMLDKYKSLKAELDDGDSLSRFFGVIKYFNGGVSMNHDLRIRIETFFLHKWACDKNQAFRSEDEMSLMD